ncbi:Uncharacterized protein ACMD2_15104 [Ananas comosus]|uniref:Uncharacterized protein n=1 Tax=Ananas comosus TaxID=4615 RepID=A0A199VRH8_ANACO|nr:Uncharacterized protein ACMD2_15104 [Ananas comosus]
MSPTHPLFLLLLLQTLVITTTTTTLALASSSSSSTPTPTPWPLQFHALLFMNYSGKLSMIDLWYDWPNGRNFNIIQEQLGGPPLRDLEWNNGTSFFYTLSPPLRCRSAQLDVGILRPDWLAGADYLGTRSVDGFLCNVWTKADGFITYFEDVLTNRPVHWVFYTGRQAHVMTFEVGKYLEDAEWQAPVYCFDKGEDEEEEEEEERVEQPQSIASDVFDQNLMHKRSLRGLVGS